ncbi:MAG: T9SS type A sorting domain-containing protein [Bacteroidia bacterium]|nr:T9SS type A sorting domain-containing protein [Bacteroidia bacterium]
MKKHLLSLGLVALSYFGAFAQSVTGTVSIGAGYTNQKWYSLANGEVASQSKDNWDIAFEITGYTSAIYANTQKTNFVVYQAPFSISNWASLDTAGINTWATLYNSDTTWTIGAFNKGANLSNPSDLGWGVYDMNTHIVNGDSCYVLKLSASSYKKLKIETLSGGVYTFVYSDINGANSYTQTITKSNYNGKNFAYFDLTANAVVDREPASSTWDLTFVKYTAILMMPNATPYAVVGVMSNKGVSVAQANNVTSPSNYTNWNAETFNTNITTIGHDWKTFNLATNEWKIVNDTVYFIEDKIGDIWKLTFLSFGGSTNGDFVFSKEKLAVSTVGISDKEAEKAFKVSVYPNPANEAGTQLIFSAQNSFSAMVSVLDVNSRVVFSDKIDLSPGLNTRELNTNGLTAGLYYIQITAGTYSSIQKLIIQ